jgi:hypothetical protein
VLSARVSVGLGRAIPGQLACNPLDETQLRSSSNSHDGLPRHDRIRNLLEIQRISAPTTFRENYGRVRIRRISVSLCPSNDSPVTAASHSASESQLGYRFRVDGRQQHYNFAVWLGRLGGPSCSQIRGRASRSIACRRPCRPGIAATSPFTGIHSPQSDDPIASLPAANSLKSSAIWLATPSPAERLNRKLHPLGRGLA